MTRKPTPQQEAIYEAVRSGAGHLVVEALAGTGKTTTAVGCLVGTSGRVGFVAFNRHIAEELQQRLPPGVPACTLHSLGYAAVQRAFPGVDVDEQKLTKLARELAPDEYPSVRIAAERLTRLVKYTLTDESDHAELDWLVEHYGVEVDDRDLVRVFKLTGKLVEASARQTNFVDYDDQVWFPTQHSLSVDQFDLLILDEAQDLNTAQQALAKKATASGRLCPIGDRHQAIYGFAGADTDSLPNLTRQLAARTLPLTITWRCPASHVELAQRLVPDLETAPGAEEGEIATDDLPGITRSARPGDLVICRKNAPVVSLTYKLVLAGVPAMMRGREIGKGLIGLIRRLKPDSISNLIDRLEDYRSKEERRLMRKDAPTSQFEALADRCDCLGQLAAQVTSLEQLEQFIGSKFDDNARPGGQVVLSSIHRAKGLEADNVFVLDPESLPLIRRDSKPWQIVQEKNLAYVAVTRSKRRLIFEDHLPSLFTG